MIQVLFGLRTSQPTGTNYADLMGIVSGWSSSETVAVAPWAAPGVFRHLVLELAAAPGVGMARTFTLRKNSAGTALTVTISDTATTGRLTGVDVTVAAGDRLSLQHTQTGTPAATGIRWSVEFEGTTTNESGYTGVLGALANTGGTRYAGVFHPRETFTTTANDNRQVVAAAGTLTRTDALVTAAPGVGNGLTFYVNKNGVRQDGTGGTVNTACALVGTITQAAGTYSLALSPGDVVYLECLISGTFSSRTWAIGTAFTATTTGQAQICGSTNTQTLPTGATTYINAAAVAAAINATETIFGVRMLPGVTTVQLSGLQVLCSVAPGVGKTRLVDLRVSATSPGPTVTVSDTATTASDTSHTATIVDGADRWNLRSVPTGTPAATILFWGLIQGPVTAAPAVTRVQSFVWMPV